MVLGVELLHFLQQLVTLNKEGSRMSEFERVDDVAFQDWLSGFVGYGCCVGGCGGCDCGEYAVVVAPASPFGGGWF